VTRSNKTTHPLTDLQQAILDFLWANGPATADAVRSGIHRQHPLKDSSVRTLLRRLEARGLVSHTVEGKMFVYAAGMPSQHVAASAIRQIIQRFCSGSVEQLLVGMVDEKVLTVGELERLIKKVRKRQ
jgi:predicted transcriptional regulator